MTTAAAASPVITSPRARQPMVAAWLIVICVMVYAMILVGGATRLTNSGLSITQWNLEKGLIPPLSAARWNEEFALYQRTVEFQQQNRGMSLGDFQYIYWWEWAHRFLGKMIGLVFALPYFFFLFTGRLKGRVAPITTLFAMGGMQGAVGWWMVTSGLFSGLDVSPARLAVHLGLAFLIIGFALWLALDCFGWPRERSSIGSPRAVVAAFLGFLFCQVIFGALLAGSRGGAAYPDWPLIGGHVIPKDVFVLEPFARNFLANHATQHLFHRTLGYLVAIFALTLAFRALKCGEGRGKQVGIALGGVALAQVCLGIATVLSFAPLGLSLIHQAGAAVLWLTGISALRVSGNNIPQ